jgi:hypothetical protein
MDFTGGLIKNGEEDPIEKRKKLNKLFGDAFNKGDQGTQFPFLSSITERTGENTYISEDSSITLKKLF